MQLGEDTGGRDLENRADAVGAAELGGAVEIAVVTLHQPGTWSRAVGIVGSAEILVAVRAEGVQHAEHAAGRDLEDGARSVHAAIQGHAVVVAIGSFDQGRIQIGAIAVDLGIAGAEFGEGIELGEDAAGSQAEDGAVARAAVRRSVEIAVAAQNQLAAAGKIRIIGVIAREGVEPGERSRWGQLIELGVAADRCNGVEIAVTAVDQRTARIPADLRSSGAAGGGAAAVGQRGIGTGRGDFEKNIIRIDR